VTEYRGRDGLREPAAVAGVSSCWRSSTCSRGSTSPGSTLPARTAIHLLVEAKKLAFADRNRHAGDPAFVRWPPRLPDLQGPRRRAATAHRTSGAPAPGMPHRYPSRPAIPATFAIADGDGNAVSFIHSLSASFGSGVVAGDTGILAEQPRGARLQPREGHRTSWRRGSGRCTR